MIKLLRLKELKSKEMKKYQTLKKTKLKIWMKNKKILQMNWMKSSNKDSQKTKFNKEFKNLKKLQKKILK